MGDVGCRVVVDAYHRAMTDRRADHRALALRRRPARRGRALAARGRPDLPGDDPGLGQDPADLGRARPGRRRRGVRPGADRRRDPRPRGPDLRDRPRRRPLGHRRGRRHAAPRRPRAARPPLRRRPHPHRVRGGGARPRPHASPRCSARRAASTSPTSRTATSRRCCRSPRSAPTTCTRWSSALLDEGTDAGAARPLGAQHRHRARPLRRPHGRRRRQQPAAPRRLPRLALGREGLPLRADVRRVRRAADRPRRRARLPARRRPGVGRRRAPRRQAAARLRRVRGARGSPW